MYLKPLVSVIFIFALTACGQDYNSNSGDAALVQVSKQTCDTAPDPKLCNALKIIQTNCVSCHTNYHSAFNSFKTNELWIASGYVVAGSPDTSKIIAKLFNAGGNMPEGGSALSDADYNTLRDWIEGIK